ncbi:hypothetical protein [Clostridium amazonitimonense]|uniref:hypothetical protein n=1 Tax=Clostridium amazonitimonense TaxID=1499689 RepID=UPI000509DB86|nr:hypothetical protein [Clostridium amazonitimonense]
MLDNLFNFFNDIKTINLWDKLWIKKIETDGKGFIKRVHERKFREGEVKEINKDNKNNVLTIKEYRYNEEKYLEKVVNKNGNGSIEYINEISYNEEKNFKEIDSKGFAANIVQFCEYDREGKKVCDEMIRRIDITSDSVLSKSQYFYDETGKLSKIKRCEDIELEELFSYDEDGDLREVLIKDSMGNAIGRILYNYKWIECSCKEHSDTIKVKDNIAFQLIKKNNEFKEAFIGEFLYDIEGRNICEYRPITIKGRSVKNGIEDFNILFLMEKKFYEGNKTLPCKTVVQDEEGNILQQCYYNTNGRALKIVTYKDGVIEETIEYFYKDF